MYGLYKLYLVAGKAIGYVKKVQGTQHRYRVRGLADYMLSAGVRWLVAVYRVRKNGIGYVTV